MGTLQNRWRVSADAKRLEVGTALTALSPKARAIVEFAADPHHTPAIILHALDAPEPRNLATAIHEFFGAGGLGDR